MCPPALAIRYMGPDRRFPPPGAPGPNFSAIAHAIGTFRIACGTNPPDGH
ncbi:MAG: hypothetical protein JWM38_2766 [Sphingomonas bacterium]|nr:hypothetical protein [Sphingomonas bacterium]